MRRLPASVVVLLVTMSVASGVAPPPLPRNLTAQEQKEVDALEARLQRHVAAGQFEQAAQLAEQIVAFRKHRQGAGHWETTDARFEVATWQSLARVPEGDRAAVVRAKVRTAEGRALRERGRYREAEKPLREALGICRKVLGEEHAETASGYDRLASCLDKQGRSSEALPLARRALAIREKVLGEQHPDTASSCNTVAVCLGGQGKYTEGLALVRRALAIHRKALGEEHPDTAGSYQNVAFCLGQQGKHDEALLLHRRALAIHLRLHGEHHAATASSLSHTARSLLQQGKYAQALPLYDRALAVLRQVHGKEHPATAVGCNNLGSCLLMLNRDAEALPHFQGALRIFRAVHGEQHPHTAVGCLSVARCLERQRKYVEAQPLFERALAICRKVHGEQHPLTGSVYSSLASCMDNQGKYGEAVALYQRSLTIHLELLGEKHSHTADSLNNLAYCLHQQGKYGEALPLHQRALAIRLEVHGEQHRATANSFNNVASCLLYQGKTREALPLFRRALVIESRVLGEKHLQTATSCNNVALCLQKQGQRGEALKLYQRALAIMLEVSGEHHANTAICCMNVALCLSEQGKHDEARTLYQRALAINLQVHGTQHPHTAVAWNSLASSFARLERWSEGLRLIQASLPDQEAARFQAAATGFDRALAAASTASPHALLAAGLARLAQPRNALRHAELALARGLLDDLAGSDRPQRDRLATLSAELDHLGQRLVPLLGLSALSAEQTALRDQLVRRRRTLETERARLASEASARQVLPLEHIQRHIPADAALVLWLDELDEHLGCVLRQEGSPAWVSLRGSGPGGSWTNEDTSLPERCYARLTDPRAGAAFREQLYRQRLAPLQEHLQGVKHLLVVPTGAMAAVPVEALTERWVVSYVPSGSAFARAAELSRKPRSTAALVLADPAFTGTAPTYPPGPAHGLLVKAVVSGSLAARVGLRAGDVLLEYAGKTLKAPDDLGATKGGEWVAVKLWRQGKTLSGRIPTGTLGVVVDQRPLAVALAAWRAGERSLLALTRGKEWTPLPGTRLEAQALASLLPKAKLLLGSAASEQTLEEMASSGKLKGLSLLHLATHGEANPTRPLDTALILAQDRLPGPKEQEARVLGGKKPLQGRLTVDTILRTWQLDAELVTLSACQSGLGADARGEGMLGFAQALLQKGARSVLLSRWKVDDSATALLMVRFYENLLGKREGLKRPLPRAEALSEAKQWLRTLPRRQAEKLVERLAGGQLRGTIDEALPLVKGKPAKLPEGDRPFAHPYYWAAFVLIGDPR
jgi:tetratricopeptide (TPR) repeat protein